MYKHDHSKQFASTTRAAVAVLALTALSGGMAHAQATQLSSASQLGAGAGMAGPFPTGTGVFQSLASGFKINAGGNTLTFTATAPGASTDPTAFESVISNGQSTNYAVGTSLLNTFDGPNATITGPLQIDFAQGVTAFGLNAEDEASDTETFTFTLFNGATQLFPSTNPANGFTSGPVANFATFDSMGNIIGGGKSVFLGAQATGGNVITRVVITSLSQTPDGKGGTYTGNSNDFVISPLSITPFAPVPEASTSVSCGMGVLLFAGLIFGARKRKASRAL